MTKEWDSETTYEQGDIITLNGREVRILAVSAGGGITDLENVEPGPARGAIEALTMRVARLERMVDALITSDSVETFDTHLGPVKVAP